MSVPNKTIYVSDGDLPLFERAQELSAGNLSGAIAQAVRAYVDAAEQVILRQYRPVTVHVGPAGSRRRQRFTAVLLAEWSHAAGSAGLVEAFSAYRTVRERYAVYRRIAAAQERPVHPGARPGGDWAEPASDLADGPGQDDQGEAVLEIHDSLDALTEHAPPEFARLVAAAAADLEVEDLDI
jgi:EXLDI family protein